MDPRTLRNHLPWTLDATQGASIAALDALDWSTAFADLAATEAGARVNTSEDRAVGHTWLRAPESAPTPAIATAITDASDAARSLADRVLRGALRTDDGSKFTDLLHIGIGGSALGPQFLCDALGSPEGLGIHFVDNVDPDGIARVLDRLGGRLATCLVTVASKSGGTVETRLGMAAVRREMEARGLRWSSRAIALTMPGSALDREASGWLASLPLWEWVGGRFGVTSVVGLLPVALAGADPHALLGGAEEMDSWTRVASWRNNPAALLAGNWFALGHGRGERDLVVLPYVDRLGLLGRFLQQLVMESVGKETDRAGRLLRHGLTVYGNKGSTDQHAFVQQLRDGRDDALVHFLAALGDGDGDGTEVGPAGATTGDHLHGFLLGTRAALRVAGRPTLTLTVRQVDARSVGGLVALFERAVGLYASLVGLNAYDQPGVEAGKRAATASLEALSRLRTHLARGPTRLDGLADQLGIVDADLHHLLDRLVATGRAQTDGLRWWA